MKKVSDCPTADDSNKYFTTIGKIFFVKKPEKDYRNETSSNLLLNLLYI